MIKDTGTGAVANLLAIMAINLLLKDWFAWASSIPIDSISSLPNKIYY